MFGHSHEPVNEVGEAGQWLLNPGSPTERRRQPHHTVAVVDLGADGLDSARVVVLDRQR